MKNLLLMCMLVIAMMQCAPQLSVYTDHDPDYEVAGFLTYNWKQKGDIESNGNPLYYNELNDQRIKAAVTHALSDHGYVFSETDAEMRVHYHIVVTDQTFIATEPYGYFYGPYWSRMRAYNYQEGSLIIDLMDSKTNHLIWRGWVTAALDEIDPENTEKIIDRAVSKIFRKFPDAVRNAQDVISKKEVK